MYPRNLEFADCIVIEGSNMAECHPVAFRWPMPAKAKGAKLIHVDPRFTRPSAMADPGPRGRIEDSSGHPDQHDSVAPVPQGPPFEPLIRALRKPLPRRDETLQDPRTVLQLLKRHFSRYTVDMVEQVTGCPREIFL